MKRSVEDQPVSPGMMDEEYWSTFSSDFADYDLGPTIGFGASSIVYSAVHRPTSSKPTQLAPPSVVDEGRPVSGSEGPRRCEGNNNNNRSQENGEKKCAIKVSGHHPDVELLFKETRLLSLCRHPNVLRNLATFSLPPDHQRIALVTPLISGGSLAGILEWRSRLAGTPNLPNRPHLPKLRIGKRHEDERGRAKGTLDEEEIKAVVKQVLQGLAYLHAKGFIHRDVKAGNLLVDLDGTILLGDFGVGGDINDAITPPAKIRPLAENMVFHEEPTSLGDDLSGMRSRGTTVDNSGKRKSFVGTPNWMAPEVVLGQKYDSKADIWSLGITIIELASGVVPGIGDKPSKVLSNTVTQPAPTLDRSHGDFSRTMKDFVDTCLDKDPITRPTAEQLLDHQWMKGAKKKPFLAESLLTDVPSIEARQEIRRVPSIMSMVSTTSSWDFSATPSIPATPIRSSTHGLRSPSVSYFGDTGLHSRDASQSSGHLPLGSSSPRISLRQWAERTASDGGDDKWRRSASETGRQRSTPLRRKTSVPFDPIDREYKIRADEPSVPMPSARRLASMHESAGMSPLMEATNGSPMKLLDTDGMERLELEGLGIRHAVPLSMAPDEAELATPQAMSRGSTYMSRSSTRASDGPCTPRHGSEERTPPGIIHSETTSQNEKGAIFMEKDSPRKDKAVKTHWWSRKPKEAKALKEDGGVKRSEQLYRKISRKGQT